MHKPRIDPYLSDYYKHCGYTREQVAALCQQRAARCFILSKGDPKWIEKPWYVERAAYYYQQARLIMGIE